MNCTCNLQLMSPRTSNPGFCQKQILDAIGVLKLQSRFNSHLAHFSHGPPKKQRIQLYEERGMLP